MVGHAFEARIYAENPRNDFLPDSGRLLYLSAPVPTHIFAPPAAAASRSVAPAVRVEQGFGTGAQIGVFYDPMIAKLVVHGADRTEALRTLRVALEEYQVVGVTTNIPFLRALASHPAFIAAQVETGFIPVCLLFFAALDVIKLLVCLEISRRAAPTSYRASSRALSPSCAFPNLS
jgi:3-methylcrotonyl-CoA carboxylase alpha subunit